MRHFKIFLPTYHPCHSTSRKRIPKSVYCFCTCRYSVASPIRRTSLLGHRFEGRLNLSHACQGCPAILQSLNSHLCTLGTQNHLLLLLQPSGMEAEKLKLMTLTLLIRSCSGDSSCGDSGERDADWPSTLNSIYLVDLPIHFSARCNPAGHLDGTLLSSVFGQDRAIDVLILPAGCRTLECNYSYLLVHNNHV